MKKKAAHPVLKTTGAPMFNFVCKEKVISLNQTKKPIAVAPFFCVCLSPIAIVEK
jgi:hypothetical protein